jgi:hypothetical protein
MKKMAFKKSPPGGGIGHVNAPSLDRQQRNVWTIRTDLVAAALFNRGIHNLHPIYDARLQDFKSYSAGLVESQS